MKVLAEIQYIAVVEVEIPDGLSDEDARKAALAAVDVAVMDDDNLETDWSHTTYFKEDPSNLGEYETDQWFDVG